MLLLCFDDQQNLTWKDFTDDHIPPYAILSHTWGIDEVTYEKLMAGQAQNLLGYKKIIFCGERAKFDGLKHFWVDSCCINKESSAELSEAVISMFRWYEGATKCYVYLSDVSSSKQGDHDIDHHPDWCVAPFCASRWFTRGWTLQELLAPRCVQFFSAEHQPLGDKSSLASLIHDITKISFAALRGQPLETVSIATRKGWIGGRETIRPEDLAYCQLGIFGVWMIPAYGEGKNSANRRLNDEIMKLPYTESESKRHTLSATGKDHYYTIQKDDDYARKAGYLLERVDCFVYDRRQPGTIPIYQYLSAINGDHFYTWDAEEGHQASKAGYVFEMVAFFVLHVSKGKRETGMIPLQRFYDSNPCEHFYSAEEREQRAVIQAGFRDEGVLGCVFPVKTEQTVPLYRWYKE